MGASSGSSLSCPFLVLAPRTGFLATDTDSLLALGVVEAIFLGGRPLLGAVTGAGVGADAVSVLVFLEGSGSAVFCGRPRVVLVARAGAGYTAPSSSSSFSASSFSVSSDLSFRLVAVVLVVATELVAVTRVVFALDAAVTALVGAESVDLAARDRVTRLGGDCGSMVLDGLFFC